MDPTNATRLPTSEEAEYLEYLKKKAEVERKRQLVADLQRRIQDLRWVLGQFMVEYHARVGTLQVQLEKIQLEIDEVRFRIHWLLTRETDTGLEERVDSEFAEYREQVQADEFETANAQAAFEDILEEQQGHDTDKQGKLKRLYRKLAKRYHPDLADSEEDRERRNAIMAEVNAAYDREDLTALEEISTRLDWENIEAKAESWTDRIEVLDKEIQRLDQVLEALHAQLTDIETSDTFQLWQRAERAAEQGRDLLEELCGSLTAEIEERQRVLAEWRIQYAELRTKYERSVDGAS